MATIRKLPSGKYNVQVRRDGHPPVPATFKNATDAKAWARKIEGDIDQGKHYGFSRVRTLADAVDAFNGTKATIKTADAVLLVPCVKLGQIASFHLWRRVAASYRPPTSSAFFGRIHYWLRRDVRVSPHHIKAT